MTAYQKTYKVKLTGTAGIIMHSDDYKWSEQIADWLKQPGNKIKGTAGDDRYPAWKWVGYCYSDGGHIVIPADNLMSMFRIGGTKCPTGKGKGSFKTQTQTGMVVNEVGWKLRVNGALLNWKDFEALIDNPDFAEHEEFARKNGFMLFGKRVSIGQGKSKSKHIRIRPRFDNWDCEGTITVTDSSITKDVLEMILGVCGRQAGLCDWRPGSSTPGPWGTFTATVTEVK